MKFADEGLVTVAASASRAGLEFCIVDTSVGIEPAKHRVIFNTFRQADGSPTRRHNGAGIGLSTARCPIEMLGGAISCDSAPGRGSTFRVWLPCKGKSP